MMSEDEVSVAQNGRAFADGSASLITAHPANRWDTPNQCGSPEQWERYEKIVVDSNGKMKYVPLRRGKADSSFIDAISFTFHESTLKDFSGKTIVSDDEYILQASISLEQIFGFGISQKLDHSGGRFYDACWLLGTPEHKFGRVHFGGQNSTMLVEIFGTGCNAAKNGWEQRLYLFLFDAVRPSITRVDLAKDFFDGEYSPEQAFEDWEAGLFNKSGKCPAVQKVGSDWWCDTQDGKTVYIGKRKYSNFFARIYDKAKEQGDSTGMWCRFEVELKGKTVLIPLDVLLFPGQYFSGAFPVCAQFSDLPANRLKAKKKSLSVSYEHVLKYARTQVGRVINMLKVLNPDDDSEIVRLLKPNHEKLPKRLFSDVIDFIPIHKRDLLSID